MCDDVTVGVRSAGYMLNPRFLLTVIQSLPRAVGVCPFAGPSARVRDLRTILRHGCVPA